MLGLAALLLLAARGAHAQEDPPRPTLVVLLAVDQLRADYLDRFGPQLQGGLARLVRGGALFRNAHHDHAITETAPGHATMLSGRFPSGTGIVRNADGVNGTGHPLLGGGGLDAAPVRFRGTTLMDWLARADPRARGLSVSRKDRSAILPIGRSRQQVFWYATDGRFTTSTWYADALPEWIERFNARASHARYAGASWTPLLPPGAYPEPDSVPREGGGAGFTFPHRLPDDAGDVALALPDFPVMDSLLAQLALEGVRALGLGAGPQIDLLAVSFSTTDAVGHRYGPDSRELHDQILRLDRYLGTFLDSLYTLVDSGRVAIALTSDHGVAPFPELHAERAGAAPRRVDLRPTMSAFRRTLVAAGAPPDAVELEGFVRADRGALLRAGLDADEVLGRLAAALRQVPGVQRVDRVADLARADTAQDQVARRWLHMLPADVGAELTVTLEPFAYAGAGVNASHGTPHDYDNHVPLIFYGPGFAAGAYDDPARIVDLAPTLAAALGIAPLEPLDGKVLTRALRPRDRRLSAAADPPPGPARTSARAPRPPSPRNDAPAPAAARSRGPR